MRRLGFLIFDRYQYFVGLSPTCNTKLSLPPCPCQTASHIVDTALGERELNPPMRVYQTRVFTSSPPPIARGCSASCSKVLFHTGLLQGIAPIREFPCRHVHSQTHGRNTGTRTLSASPQTSRAHPLTLYSDCYMKS